MKFRVDEYFRAGAERTRQARMLHHAGGSYVLAMYGAGVAVECILRAFRWSEDASFEGRHDSEDLLAASKLLQIDEEYLRARRRPEREIASYTRELRTAGSEVVSLWHNNLSFCPETSLRAHLNRMDRMRGIRGDAVKKNSRGMMEAAQLVVDRGITLWNSRKK